MNNNSITKYLSITAKNVYVANVKRYECKDGKTFITNFSINFGTFKNSTQQKWISCVYFGDFELLKGDRINITKAYLDYDLYNNKFGVPTIKAVIRVKEFQPITETQLEQETITDSLPETSKPNEAIPEPDTDLEWFDDENR